MDNKMGESEQNNLINELTQGRELAKLLQIQLNTPSFASSSHDQTLGLLVQKIISSYDKSISMLIFSSSSSTPEPKPTGPLIESPPSLSGSPRSDQDSDGDVKDSGQDLKDGSKKRNTFPRRIQKVRVSPRAGLEGALDDGFSWRKYGQKDILGAKYPRGYYRCAHRQGQGCSATKHVQRSNEDPTIFEITYRGDHTCAQFSKSAFPPRQQPETQEPNTSIEPQQHNFYQTQQQQPEEALSNLRKDLKIVTPNSGSIPLQSPFPSFPFPSTSASASMVINSNFRGNILPSFISAQASGSTNYNFSASPSCGINNFQGSQRFQRCSSHDSELNDIISGAAAAATSATNSPTIGLDFDPFCDIEFDPNFTF